VYKRHVREDVIIMLKLYFLADYVYNCAPL